MKIVQIRNKWKVLLPDGSSRNFYDLEAAKQFIVDRGGEAPKIEDNNEVSLEDSAAALKRAMESANASKIEEPMVEIQEFVVESEEDE